jgi:hypothetical protein
MVKLFPLDPLPSYTPVSLKGKHRMVKKEGGGGGDDE